MSRIILEKGLISKIQLRTGCNFTTALEIVDSQEGLTIEDNSSKGMIEGIISEYKHLKGLHDPKMVRYEGDGFADGEMVYDIAYCPSCEHIIEEDSENWKCLFCPECGQALKWSEDI